MGSKLFYGMFAFTLAFLLGLVGYWTVNKQYVSQYSFHEKSCPKYRTTSQANTINYNSIYQK